MDHIQELLNGVFFDQPYARIEEVKDLGSDYQNHIEVRQCHPGWIGIYTRVHNGIGDFGKGVKRNMMAATSLNVDQVRELHTYLGQWLERNGGAK